MESGWLGWEEGSDFPLAAPIDTFITVGNVEEKVLFMVLLRHKAKYVEVINDVLRGNFSNGESKLQIGKYLIQLAHCGRGGWNDVVYKEEERILSSQVDSFPDEEVKLAHCQKNTGYNSCWLIIL